MFYALAGGIGALLAYFFDPQNGKRRRKVTVDWVAGRARGTARSTGRARRSVGAEAYGLKQKVAHRTEEEKDFDDVTLARKVETEIFRPDDAPKGSVDVNVEDGVVYLRGEVERPELIEELVTRTREVQGVRDVASLLHLPGDAAPTKG